MRIRKLIETGEDAPKPTGRGIIDILQIGNTDINENINYGIGESTSKFDEKSNEMNHSPTKFFGESLLNFTFN